MQTTKKRCDKCGAKKSKSLLIETDAYILCSNCAGSSTTGSYYFAKRESESGWVNDDGLVVRQCAKCGAERFVPYYDDDVLCPRCVDQEG